MKKYLFSPLCFFIFSVTVTAQDSAYEKAKPALDTAAILEDLMNLLDAEKKPVSYGLVSVGFSNRLFSLRNNQINAKQSSTSTLVYSPSTGYFHKSGFSLSAGANLLSDKKKGLTATQYSLTPSFDLLGNKHWSMGVSYSRYFISDKYSDYASPVQNDLYAYANYKKHWIEPGIAVGYSTGNFTEINKFTVQLTGNTFIDTGTYKINSFSMVTSISHDFEWNSLFGAADGLSLTPTLQMNFSSDSTQGISHTIGANLVRFLSRRRKLAKLQGKNSFQAQSVALSLDLNYSIGKFTVLPQIYLDYYLPATDEKRFTQTFTLSAGYIF